MPAQNICMIRFLISVTALVSMPCVWAAVDDDAHEVYRSVLETDFSTLDAEAFSDSGWTVAVGETFPFDSPADRSAWSIEGASGVSAGLCLVPDLLPLALVSPSIVLDSSCRSLSGAVLGTGENRAEAMLFWLGGDTVLRCDRLRTAPVSTEKRRRFNLSETTPPEQADAAHLVLIAYPGAASSFCWGSARMTGAFFYEPEVTVMINRIGYEQVGPKHFTVRANFRADRAAFHILDGMHARVLEGTLGTAEIVTGARSAVWDHYYYRGNFSALHQEGRFQVVVQLDEHPPIQTETRVGFHLLWDETFAPALAPFKTHRVAFDPKAPAFRLWNDACSADIPDAELLWELVHAWRLLLGVFGDAPGFRPLHDEVMYGVEHLCAWLTEGNGVERSNSEEHVVYAALLATVVRRSPEGEPMLRIVRGLMEPLMDTQQKGMLVFSAAVDLYGATGDASYLDYAKKVYPGVSTELVEPLLEYEGIGGAPASTTVSRLFTSLAERMLPLADNPFGLAQTEQDGHTGYFIRGADATQPLLGNTTRLLDAAIIMAQAYRYAAHPDYLTFVYDQLNWLLGNNPYGICLIEGLGDAALPQLALPEGRAREDAFGAVVHGIGPEAPERDRPFFDVSLSGAVSSSTNGYCLRNNARYISALAYLKRIPIAQPRLP